MKKMEIRKATNAEIGQILKLLVQVNLVHHNGRPDLFKGPVTKYTENELKKLMKQADRPIFVCMDGERLLGYAFCIVKNVQNHQLLADCKTLYVDDLCVDEAVRGQGVGKALMAYVTDYARQLGCHNLTLNVWSFNENAMRFYESLGMHEQRRTMESILS